MKDFLDQIEDSLTGQHYYLLPLFCREVLSGARNWLTAVSGTEPFGTNSMASIRRHAAGVAPYSVGTPVIGRSAMAAFERRPRV